MRFSKACCQTPLAPADRTGRRVCGPRWHGRCRAAVAAAAAGAAGAEVTVGRSLTISRHWVVAPAQTRASHSLAGGTERSRKVCGSPGYSPIDARVLSVCRCLLPVRDVSVDGGLWTVGGGHGSNPSVRRDRWLDRKCATSDDESKTNKSERGRLAGRM